jgi:SAM-dependent methyltransferase
LSPPAGAQTAAGRRIATADGAGAHAASAGGTGRRARAADDTAARAAFPDWRFAPNIGGHPGVYEIENRALDPGGHLLAAMRRLAPWDGRRLVDLGCGTGFWLPGYAGDAARVTGVEPDPALRVRAADRIRDLPRAEVLPGSAERLPLPDRSVDVVHARFAYFLTPGIVGAGTPGVGGPGGGGAGKAGPPRRAPGDAGLAEVMRVLVPGGTLIVVDNNYRWGEFAGLLAAGSKIRPQRLAAGIDAWWRERGATRHEVRSRWAFASRADLAAVLEIEVPAAVARAWLARHPTATGLSCGYVLFAVTRPERVLSGAMTRWYWRFGLALGGAGGEAR